MITILAGSWWGAGLAVGLFHCFGVRQSAFAGNVMLPIWGMARMFVVGSVLTMGAIQGGLLPVAMGWGVGFFGALLATYGWSK